MGRNIGLCLPSTLDKIGILLVVIGVSAWVPYIALRLTGASPSIFPYLPIHLLSIIPGALIRQRRRVKKLASWMNR
ncbi:MAG: hypothetical protein HYY22_08640 [Thaumarchaeota archaeon]|nr:hypothetical protein [Nitrososphaerota archaeon]